MVAIKIENFGGMIPILDDRLLPPSGAARVENAWLKDGRLRGFREPRLVHALTNTNAKSVFRIPLAGNLAVNIPSSIWLEFVGQNVSFLRSPVQNQTDPMYYYCGDTPIAAPRYTTLSRLNNSPKKADLILGIPQPSGGITSVTPAGGASTINEARSYVYTYVSAYGEEGPPCNPVNATNKSDATYTLALPAVPDADRGDIAKVTTAITKAVNAQITCAGHGYTAGMRLFVNSVVGMTQINGKYVTVVNVVNANNFTIDLDTTSYTAYASGGTVQRIDRELTLKRIYRTVVASTGTAQFVFVADVPINATTYADAALSSSIGNNTGLQTATWFPPPTDLAGFVSLPNGMMVGWVRNEVWFCEPYRPHAWPSQYQLLTDYNIVGIGVVGNSAVICTEGSPYICSGNHPSAMAMSRVSALSQPCLSQGSIVSTPSGVYYGAAVGLILVTPGAADNATAKLLSQDRWQELVVLSRMNAAMLSGAYFCFSGVGTGCFDPVGYEPSAFEQADYSGTKNGALIDFTDDRIAFGLLTSTQPTYKVMQDPWTSEVLILRGTSVYQVDLTGNALEGQFTWKSRIYRMDYPTNLAGGVCYYNFPPEQPNETLTLNVYGGRDGTGTLDLIYTVTVPASGSRFRLPAGARYDYYQFEFIGAVQLQSAVFATSFKELLGN